MAATRFLTLSLLFLSLLLLPSTTLPNPTNYSFYGGAQITTTSIHLPNHSLITLNKPLNFISPISFSTHFSFSLSPNSTLSLLLIPKSFPLKHFQLFSIEFSCRSIRIGEKTAFFHPGRRQNGNFSTGTVKNGEKATFFDLGSRQNENYSTGSVKNGEKTTFFDLGSGQNVDYSAGLVKNGEKMTNFDPGNPQNVDFSAGSIKTGEKTISFDSGNQQIYEAFVNYSAGSRLIEVRLGNGSVLFFPVDLPRMWKKEDVLLGLESSFNSSVVYSWRLTTRVVPKGLHSMPVDPRARVRVRSKNAPCYLTMVSAVMIAIGCCVFVVFMVMFFKVNFTDWDEVMEMEYVLKPVGKGYEKVGVDVENNVYGNVKC